MTFNSIAFALFFPIVFLLYWFVFQKTVKQRNVFLIIVSYFFYGYWDWRFLSLLMFSTAVDFYVGQRMGREERGKIRWLWLSLTVNLGILFVFKYFGFFIDSFVSASSLAGIAFHSPVLHIILPVGLSFYTFQSLSYTLDVYHGKMKPADSLIDFAAYISFFPQLVAGPIERARNFLPQFTTLKTITYDALRSGLLLIAFGLFKKIVLADRLGRYVDASFDNLAAMDGLPLLVAIIFFAFQLYLDFSAYSDIARGTARMLGFDLSLNFRQPYLSAKFSEFWRRWHISLSSWFRDYVYFPLGGNRKRHVRNVLLVFVLSGLWHGASWNFVIWGALNGIFLVAFDPFLTEDVSVTRRLLQTIFVFAMWTISLIFFRSQTMHDALHVFSGLLKPSSTSVFDHGLASGEFLVTIFSLVAFMMFEWLVVQRGPVYPRIAASRDVLRWTLYVTIVLSVVFFGSYGAGLKSANFIYFQF